MSFRNDWRRLAHNENFLAFGKLLIKLANQESQPRRLSVDNSFLAQNVARGEPVLVNEIVESAACARALYNVATLTSRDFDRLGDCYKLWRRTGEKFDQLCQAWDSVPQDGGAIVESGRTIGKIVLEGFRLTMVF
jgi:hypothetical protein